MEASSSSSSSSSKPTSDKKDISEDKSKQSTEEKETKSENEVEPCNDLIIKDGFPALNNFRLPHKKKENNDTTVNDPIPRQPFASYANALSLSSNLQKRSHLLEDCQKVFTARTKDGDAAYSAGCTFFVPCHMKPRCALEQLALDVFRAHTKGLEGLYDEERSGAEWWTLVLESSSSNDTKDDTNQEKKKYYDDDEYDDDDDEVGMHFDADYGLESQLPNYMLHPRVATVTYLSDVGVPTLVLDKKSPPPTDLSKSSLMKEPIGRGWLSHPLTGKHIAFDGRLLHGAPGTFFPAANNNGEGKDGDDNSGIDAGKDGLAPDAKRQKKDEGGASCSSNVEVSNDEDDLSKKRVTFLVNVWLNHCPIDAELLDDETCESLTSKWQAKEDEGKEKNSSMMGKGKRKKGDNDDDDVNQSSFEWKLQDASKPDHFQTTRLETAAASGDTEPAGSEETVLCNREVTIFFNSSMKECHKASRLAALDSSSQEGIGGVGKSAQIDLGEKALTIDVGNEVESSDDEEDESGK